MNTDGKDSNSRLVVRTVPSSYERCPVSSLPPELLSLIFVLAQPKRRFRHKIPLEVVLSHVSKFWRDVALTTPALWSRIDIYSVRSTKWVPYYLRRSGSHICLDLCIDVYRADKSRSAQGTMARANRIRAATIGLRPHFHRIRHLFILCCHEQTALALLSSFTDARMPNLQSFKVKFGHGAQMTVRRSEFNIFLGGSPQLTFLETDLPNILPAPMTLTNLATLYLHITDALDLNFNTFTAILTSSPALLHLSLQGTINLQSWPLHSTGPKFTVKNLKSLRLLYDGRMAVHMILSLSAPKLESLWLDCSLDDFQFVFDAPQMAGRPKFPALKYLTIQTNLNFVSERFADIFPTITHLHFPYPHFDHIIHLQNALAGRWISLHTMVFTMFRERNAQKLLATLGVILPMRRNSGHPITSLLVDEDHRRMLRKSLPLHFPQINIEVVSVKNYHEVWWNMPQEHQDMD